MEKHLFYYYYLFVCLFVLGVMTADQIWPNKDAFVIKEDENVALSCSYTSSGSVYLYWYRQYPNKELQYLVYSSQSSSGRFRMTESQKSTELTITGVTLSDSALYYCALRVLAQ
uniref:Ig-like domain-containing protein n=1 Tax=Cyprinus carpio TaxID=7962 RepID=A0A8C1W7R1_CYPCA